LTDNPPGDKADLETMLRMARNGELRIWHSTLIYTEVRPALLEQGNFENVEHLVSDMEGVLLPVSPNPNVMMVAGKLRDHQFKRPDGIRQATEKNRVMSVPDAIQLATCLHLRDDRGIPQIEFHTFDDGRGKNYEERAVSLLRLEEYSSHLKDVPEIQQACALPRLKPILPQAGLGIF
jgi:hypothetical protein